MAHIDPSMLVNTNTNQLPANPTFSSVIDVIVFYCLVSICCYVNLETSCMTSSAGDPFMEYVLYCGMFNVVVCVV